MLAHWTTTAASLWQIDCENFRKANCPFELLEVTSEEHRRFVEAFAARYGLRCRYEGTNVVFEPLARH
jgi:hypothetical protein